MKMKSIIILFSFITLLIIGCHKKAVPVITGRTEFPAAPGSAIQPLADNSPEAIAAGKIVFETRCNRCHDLQDAKTNTTERWESILKTMIPKAKLNDGEAKQVTAYVMANAKK